MPVGRHISLRAEIGESKVIRAYTPTTLIDNKGYFDLLIKSYEFGKLSTYLHSLKPGDCVDIRGPVGRFKYEKNKYSCIGLIAGGTGLTPCLQVIRAVLLAPDYRDDQTDFVLFYQNRTEADILLHSELKDLSTKYPHRLQIFYFLTNAQSAQFGVVKRDKRRNSGASASKEFRGYITSDLVNAHLAPDICPFVCICGPSGFNDFTKSLALSAGHTEETVYIW